MTNTEQYCTLRCALHNASSFYATLAQAGLVADPSDLVKLFEAFPALISDYGPRQPLLRPHVRAAAL